MARQPRFEYPGAVYHVMARGDGGKQIFVGKDDWIAVRLAMGHPVSMSQLVHRMRRNPTDVKRLKRYEKALKTKDWTDPGLVNDTPDPVELAELRRQVLGWRSKISQLSRKSSQAQANPKYSNQTSAPRSLETWSARSERLGAELTRARVSLVVAKAKLAEIAPNDPLLRSSDLTH